MEIFSMLRFQCWLGWSGGGDEYFVVCSMLFLLIISYFCGPDLA